MKNIYVCCAGQVQDNAITSCCHGRFWLDLNDYERLPKGRISRGVPFNLHTEFCCILSNDHVRILAYSFREHCLLTKGAVI